MYRIGVDTGGTNTDIVLTNVDSGEIYTTKTKTTKELIDGIFHGIEHACSVADIHMSELTELVYGTTIVVNMIAQRESESIALITTEGFKDALEIGRAWRDEQIYNNFLEKPQPLVERNLRYEIEERLNFQGEVIKEINLENVREVVSQIKEMSIKSIAVCLLHSYKNSVHELAVKRVIEEIYPEAYVSLSHEVNPEFREYERTSTTAINAYMMPNMVSHLYQFKNELQARDIHPSSYMMNANAGIMSFDSAIKKPVSVSNSGPIGGIIAANYLGSLMNEPNIITFDMGGTSCDVSLIQNNIISFKSDSEVSGYPISIPTVDLDFIGAGGGSIAWCDKGGALKVGPKSAGSIPGPICYETGGTNPTVTDANLLLGRIRPETFSNSEAVTAKVEQIMESDIAQPLNLDVLQAAEGIIEIVNANMSRAIKLVSVQKGFDPSEFTLFSFGGAGGLHSAKIAEELEIPKVVVPYSPGTFAAFGQVLADIKHDFVYTDLNYIDDIDAQQMNEYFDRLIEEGIQQLQEENVEISNQVLIKSIDLRYFGQAYELNIPLQSGNVSAGVIEEAIEKFHTLHEDTYGHSLRGDKVEIVKYRVSSIGTMDKQAIKFSNNKSIEKNAVNIDEKTSYGEVIFSGEKYTVPIYERKYLQKGFKINEPCIITEMGATTVVYPNQAAEIDENYSIVIYTNVK
ncbi:5-oxoprolinase [Siminovitchia terrae]|uniref:hydantoinase/oxoprolinase family protein n=1 Tax=Siminovitchia terrae TaxID=1914933 RepID=UPI001AFE1AED|nr:hydantoinase/oxoprolinase family protein [Siminovitchia terrae]GIN93807.1 5-oxoprolinase [Siminovitchia terrae]